MRRLVLLLCILGLALPTAAGAATPGFALWDLQTDLAAASRNVYGDVAVKPAAALAGKGTVVRCAAWCRFGHGSLAFAAAPRLSSANVAPARFAYSKRKGWFVQVTLRPAAVAHWQAFVRNVTAKAKRGVLSDVLVVTAGGQVAATPLATQVTTSGSSVTIPGFSRAGAKALQIALNS
jgi:hypothetical protein